MKAEALLELSNIACVRGGRLLFEGLDLALQPGDAALVAGLNGAGKSSLIRLAAGLLAPAAGSVRRHVSLALADESAALDEQLSLGRALAFWARLDGASADAGIEAMALHPLRNVPVRMLSAGQRKRAALARVIASGAPVWLLDEPANGLDADAQLLLAGAMAEHRRSGGAILAASHQPLGLDGAQNLRLGAS